MLDHAQTHTKGIDLVGRENTCSRGHLITLARATLGKRLRIVTIAHDRGMRRGKAKASYRGDLPTSDSIMGTTCRPEQARRSGMTTLGYTGLEDLFLGSSTRSFRIS